MSTNNESWNIRLSTNKTRLLMERGFEISGYVLTHPKTGDRQIVEMGAVRKLSNDEMWRLMHPASVPMPLNLEAPLEELTTEVDGHALVLCPFCKAGEFLIRECGRIWNGTKYGDPSSVEIMHHCTPIPGQPSRPIIRVGRDVESAVAAWNKRG